MSHEIGQKPEAFSTAQAHDCPNISKNTNIISWLVVSTPLKNISQLEGLSHILWKIKNVPNHQPVSSNIKD